MNSVAELRPADVKAINKADKMLVGRCTRCPKLCQGISNRIQGSGPQNADIMFVGEALGRVEDETGKPFVGMVGQFLRKDIFPFTGLSVEEVRLDNAVRCRPTKLDKKTGELRDRPPTIREIENCRSYLVEAINRVKPKVIIVSGSSALASVLSFHLKLKEDGEKKQGAKAGGILTWRGKQIWHPEFNCWVIPIPHPSYTMRLYRGKESQPLGESVCFMELAGALATKPRPVFSRPKTHILVKPENVKWLFTTVLASKVFAFDIETSGNVVVGMSFAVSSKHGYYVPFESVSGENMNLFKKIIASTKHVKLMHNGAYELRVLRANGFVIYDKYYDTMLAAHMCDENFEKGLKALAWIYTSFGGYELRLQQYRHDHKISAKSYGKVPLSILGEYGAFDAVATYILYEKLSPKMKKECTYSAFSHIMMPMRRVLSSVEMNGICYDVDGALELKTRCEGAVERLADMVNEKAGQKVNVNAAGQLARILFDKMGFKSTALTKGGSRAVDRFVLAKIAAHPRGAIARDIVALKFVDKMLSTYVKRGLSLVDGDGRIHVSYNLAGTVTGRASCTIHNVPRDRLLRSLYMASEGCKLVEADLTAAEIVYLAAESGEEVLLNALEEGRDVHADTARAILGIPSGEEVSKEQRQIGKTINFGVIYGMSPPGLAERLGITEEAAKDYIKTYFEKLPKVRLYTKMVRANLKRDGYVKNLLGWRRRLPGIKHATREATINRMMRQAVNSGIQDGAALYAYIGSTRLYEMLLEEKMSAMIVHSVHDNELTDTPIPEIKRVTEMAYEAFETRVSAVPAQMHIDVKVSKRWGEENESKLATIFERVRV
jgi:DNA polymerase-1